MYINEIKKWNKKDIKNYFLIIKLNDKIEYKFKNSINS
jgi:hypothetical protein